MPDIHIQNTQVERPDYLGGGHWNLSDLNQITVLFGKNGSGKSNLLRKIRDLDVKSHHYVAPERAGTLNVNPSLVQQEFTGANRASNIKFNFVPDYRERVLSRITAYLTKRGSIRAGSAPHAPDELEAVINPLLPPNVTINIGINTDGRMFELNRSSETQTVRIQRIEDLSSGEAEALILAIDLLTACTSWALDDESKRVLLIDEPDTHLHPDLQQRVAALIVQLAKEHDAQVIVATHSTTLLAALGHHGSDLTSVIYLDNSKADQRAMKFNDQLREMALFLGGHALMGPLFGAPLLLVEGDDDYATWSQVPRHHVVNFSVIPCGGEQIYNYHKTLDRILSCVLDGSKNPSGYTILDGDKHLPQQGSSSQEHIKFLKLSCWETENLYLTDEVLSELGLTWEEAKQKIKANASSALSMSHILECVEDWDRKNDDLKSVIKEVARILDEKNLPWTYRLGKVLGKRRPEGQLLDFLSGELVSAIWGPAEQPSESSPTKDAPIA